MGVETRARGKRVYQLFDGRTEAGWCVVARYGEEIVAAVPQPKHDDIINSLLGERKVTADEHSQIKAAKGKDEYTLCEFSGKEVSLLTWHVTVISSESVGGMIPNAGSTDRYGLQMLVS